MRRLTFVVWVTQNWVDGAMSQYSFMFQTTFESFETGSTRDKYTLRCATTVTWLQMSCGNNEMSYSEV